jgi:hypothetical protein
VEFNFAEIWEYKKNTSDFDPSKLHFVHVHPPVFCECSSLDINCIEGLTVAFGYPVAFSIVCFMNETTSIKSYRWQKELNQIESLDIPHPFLISLKHESHKDSTFDVWAKEKGCSICKGVPDERWWCMVCKDRWIRESFEGEVS